MRKKHLNTGRCEKCEEILNTYPGFDEGLRAWFYTFQAMHTDAHIAHAGRGRKDQEEALKKGNSKAGFGQSAHNYNAALDFFRLELGGATWQTKWFIEVVGPCAMLNPELVWGGNWKSFKDYPHVELKNWKELAKQGKLKLVE